MENINYNLNQDIREGFVTIQSNVFIKSILFTLIFYIVANIFFYNYLKIKLGMSIDPNIIQSLLFGFLFYIINVNL